MVEKTVLAIFSLLLFPCPPFLLESKTYRGSANKNSLRKVIVEEFW
jgi:hypothetical protein